VPLILIKLRIIKVAFDFNLIKIIIVCTYIYTYVHAYVLRNPNAYSVSKTEVHSIMLLASNKYIQIKSKCNLFL